MSKLVFVKWGVNRRKGETLCVVVMVMIIVLMVVVRIVMMVVVMAITAAVHEPVSLGLSHFLLSQSWEHRLTVF